MSWFDSSCAGFVGDVVVSVPWRQLWSAPVTITLSRVRATIGPNLDARATDPVVSSYAGRVDEARGPQQAPQQAQQTQWPRQTRASLLEHVLSNVCVRIQDVSLQYMDYCSTHDPKVRGRARRSVRLSGSQQPRPTLA